jgi:hypothetical protein
MRAFLVPTIVSFTLAACGGGGESEGEARAATAAARTDSDAIVHVPLFIEDVDRQPPSDPATVLYEVRKHNPVLAPDGHHITLAEFNAVQGSVSVKCIQQGTHVTLHLSNLVPKGVYTIWNVVFQAPGFDPSFANMIGLGTLGAPTGSANSFKASSSGQGSVSAITPAGPLSMLGAIGGCALTDEFEWHVVGALHLDGETHGPELGPDGTAVEQFAFMFGPTSASSSR